MTELQTILKDTLARWEEETRQSQAETMQALTRLNNNVRMLEARQTESEQDLQRLSSLHTDLRMLLQRLNSALPVKSGR